MAKRVYFSFHYEDVRTFRANVVRNHAITKENGDAGFFDASIWEDAELHGDSAVKRLINSSLENTSVTCVLIGTDTWKRRWVRYEILKSYDRGNLLFGVHINGVPDKNRQVFVTGPNPFYYLGFTINASGTTLTFYERYGEDWTRYLDLAPKTVAYESQYRNQGYNLSNWVPCYDWAQGDGYNSFPNWVENAK